jgi:signal transduction histidine kinase
MLQSETMTKTETGPTPACETGGSSVQESTPLLTTIGKRLTHRIRNPLSVIIAAAGQLQESKEMAGESVELSYVEAILLAAEQIEDTLCRFSQYACPEQPEMQTININDLCRGEISDRILENQPGPKQAIAFFEDENLPDTTCDPYQIRTALANLVDNALQSQGAGGAVTLRTGLNDKSIVITLEDDGEGIPADDLKNVFLPFFTTLPGKSGLGMAIADRIISAHNGKIGIENLVDGGTRVTVTLPWTGVSEE